MNHCFVLACVTQYLAAPSYEIHIVSQPVGCARTVRTSINDYWQVYHITDTTTNVRTSTLDKHYTSTLIEHGVLLCVQWTRDIHTPSYCAQHTTCNSCSPFIMLIRLLALCLPLVTVSRLFPLSHLSVKGFMSHFLCQQDWSSWKCFTQIYRCYHILTFSCAPCISNPCESGSAFFTSTHPTKHCRLLAWSQCV